VQIGIVRNGLGELAIALIFIAIIVIGYIIMLICGLPGELTKNMAND
jgi:hypothetical protein